MDLTARSGPLFYAGQTFSTRSALPAGPDLAVGRGFSVRIPFPPALRSASSRIGIHGIPLTGFHRCLDFFSGRLPVCAGDNLFLRAPEKIRPGAGVAQLRARPGLPAVSGAKKSRKKVAKRFGGKEKSSTFAIPFGKRGCERGEERHPDGHEEIIDKTGTEVQMKYRNNKRERNREQTDRLRDIEIIYDEEFDPGSG